MAKFNVNDIIQFTTNIPQPGDELYGYLRLASTGDTGRIVDIRYNGNDPVYIIKLANVNLRVVDENLIAKVADDDDCAYHIVLSADDIVKFPIFTEMMGTKTVDFAKIIPIPDENTSLKELWGCDTNSNDTMILDDHTVSFMVTGGIPEKIAEALSAMMPDMPLYMGAMIVSDNTIEQYIYTKGKLLYSYSGTGADVNAANNISPLTHAYSSGTTLSRLVNTLKATTDIDELMGYAVYGPGGKEFQVVIDHLAKRIDLNPIDFDELITADGQSVDDDDDDVMVPDNHEPVGIPITDASKDVRCVVDDD